MDKRMNQNQLIEERRTLIDLRNQIHDLENYFHYRSRIIKRQGYVTLEDQISAEQYFLRQFDLEKKKSNCIETIKFLEFLINY